MLIADRNLGIVGERNALIGSESGAVVDIGKGLADEGEKAAAGGLVARDADKDFGIFEIGFDVGAIAFGECENYACAPVGAFRDAVVHFDDEARNDAAEKDFVVIFQIEGVCPCSCVGFFFVQEFRN